MNVILLHTPTLVMRELRSALDNHPGIRLISLDIPLQLDTSLVRSVFEKIQDFLPAVFVSLNDSGTDYQGEMHNIIERSGSYLINWYHDDPFYDITFHNRKLKPFARRLDFVSESLYTDLLRRKGFNAFFLPLATDPQFFKYDPAIEFKRDVAFVGNSSQQFMDSIIQEDVAQSLEKNAELYAELKRQYYRNPNFLIRSELVKNRSEWISSLTVAEERFVFAFEWLIGFEYRRDCVLAVSQNFKERFTLFGDQNWDKIITESPRTPEATYYDNLAYHYQSSRVNLNINRVHIPTSFTQRYFDTKACGAFLLTEKRRMNSRYFVTDGDGQEIVEFESIQDCIDKIQYYLVHEDERLRIAENGMERILRNHTYAHRLEEIIETASRVWGV